MIVPLINNFIFRSFSPSPMQMEFKPGQSYYFISTSSDRDIHRRVGGWCSTKNMKMIFRWVYIKLSNKSKKGIAAWERIIQLGFSKHLIPTKTLCQFYLLCWILKLRQFWCWLCLGLVQKIIWVRLFVFMQLWIQVEVQSHDHGLCWVLWYCSSGLHRHLEIKM